MSASQPITGDAHAETMLAITTPSYASPEKYGLSTLPRLDITPGTQGGKEVLIKVQAASVNPVDVKLASGMLGFAVKGQFPYQLGYDVSGVVVKVGKEVEEKGRVKVGDEVFARLPEESRGSWSEYALCNEFYVGHKPPSLSFADAASLPLASMTALQALEKYRGDLTGKTVFVPAGLSGTGAFACQLAKNVLHAGKVITTVSTAKVDLVPKYLGEGVVDQIIDHTKTSPSKEIPRGSVDFILDTTGEAMSLLSLVTPKTGMIISIATMPSGTQLQESPLLNQVHNKGLPWLPRISLNIMDSLRKFRARRWGVEYAYWFLEANWEDLERVARYVEEKALRPVVGTRVEMRDIEKLREACMVIYKGKGGLGKTVIEVSDS